MIITMEKSETKSNKFMQWERTLSFIVTSQFLAKKMYIIHAISGLVEVY